MFGCTGGSLSLPLRPRPKMAINQYRTTCMERRRRRRFEIAVDFVSQVSEAVASRHICIDSMRADTLTFDLSAPEPANRSSREGTYTQLQSVSTGCTSQYQPRWD